MCMIGSLLQSIKLLRILHQENQNLLPTSSNGVNSATGFSDRVPSRQLGRKSFKFNITCLQMWDQRQKVIVGSQSSWEKGGILSQGAKRRTSTKQHYLFFSLSLSGYSPAAWNWTNDYLSYLLENTKGILHSQFEDASGQLPEEVETLVKV